ncbi:zinc-finger homeodomain protein 3 [Lactuca sativa]|uniref:zinc-finger homeodomain protein 3 n=1 Tax=Lactuca sativa TaxID=4236 RepID=UPI000CB4D228|nr:zinc-finger homeodomain protein 3 [Lactuca sativa]
MEHQGGEMALPINSTYGGGHGHGHMLHHESAPHNHIVPSSAAAVAVAQKQHQHQLQLPITNGPTRIVPLPSCSSLEESVQVPYTNNDDNRMMVRYRECLKNHAVSIGGIATDGCGEFMPSGEEGTLEALTCSACNCHRNFHRKEIEGEIHHHHHPVSCDYNYHSAPRIEVGNGRLQGHHHHRGILGRESYGYNHNHAGVLVPSRAPLPLIMSYDMGIGSFPSESDHELEDGGGFMNRHHPPLQPHQIVKKRFRTKFTEEQKEKMLSFAEKVGWKIQKQEESVVQQFCQELGIKRRVLKVWMHNNKLNLAKKINPVPINPQNQVN